jgi:hypothetical protein
MSPVALQAEQRTHVGSLRTGFQLEEVAVEHATTVTLFPSPFPSVSFELNSRQWIAQGLGGEALLEFKEYAFHS